MFKTVSIVVASIAGIAVVAHVISWARNRHKFQCYHGTWVRPKLVAGWIHPQSQTTCDDPLPFKVSEHIGQSPRPYGAYRY